MSPEGPEGRFLGEPSKELNFPRQGAERTRKERRSRRGEGKDAEHLPRPQSPPEQRKTRALIRRGVLRTHCPSFVALRGFADSLMPIRSPSLRCVRASPSAPVVPSSGQEPVRYQCDAANLRTKILLNPVLDSKRILNVEGGFS